MHESVMIHAPVPWWGDIKRGPGRELEMRWARWAVRHFGRYLPTSASRPYPLIKPDGSPTNQALQAASWGAPIPRTNKEAAAIARRGYAVLAKWKDPKRLADVAIGEVAGLKRRNRKVRKNALKLLTLGGPLDDMTIAAALMMLK